jgi:hypothetical protein
MAVMKSKFERIALTYSSFRYINQQIIYYLFSGES